MSPHADIEHAEANGKGVSESLRGRILIVDVDPTLRETLSRYLIGEGYSVWAAANGIAAVEIAELARIEMVMLDLNLPDKSGWDTFLRLTSANPSLMVIALGDKSNRTFTGAGSGVAALFEKPLNFAKLIKATREIWSEPPEKRSARAATFYRPQQRSRELRVKHTSTRS